MEHWIKFPTTEADKQRLKEEYVYKFFIKTKSINKIFYI